MSGFDNGTLENAIFAQTKQFGAVLRGSGPPAPQAGLVGDLYLDVQTWFLYGKREAQATDPWGRYLFAVPVAYQSSLKWFSASQPGNDVGVAGDYCLLWGGYNDYGMQPSIYGPKVGGNWPESGSGPDILLDPAYAGYELPVGLLDEGAPIAYSVSSQLIVAGLADEYILAIPIPQISNTPNTDMGLQSPPVGVAVNINPLYTAIDEHAV